MGILTDEMCVLGCGGNDQGQLGIGGSEDRLLPSPTILQNGKGPCHARHVCCGFSCSLILDLKGSVWVLGGRGPCTESSTPWRVRGEWCGKSIKGIAAGGAY